MTARPIIKKKSVDENINSDIKSTSEKLTRLRNRFCQQNGQEKVNYEMIMEILDEFNHRLKSLENRTQSI
jgi:hypothetical protein